MFWPDEDRFELSRIAARLLFRGEVAAALQGLLAQPDHLLFKVASLIPASLEVATGAPGWVSALFFAGASTWVLWLVAAAARAAGGDDRECLVALALAACSTTLFYYSRHLLPYDLSLGLLLLALITGLREPGRPAQSFRAGVYASLGFLTYNGYWSVAGVVLLVHVARALPHWGAFTLRGLCAAAGLLAPVVVIILASAIFGHDFIALSAKFSGTVTQGDLGQAWRFVPEYLWTAEGILLALWLGGLVAGVVWGCRSGHRRRLLWPGLTLLLAAFLIVPSDLLDRFALSARHVRVLTPFLCLAGASFLAAWQAARPASRLTAGVLLLAGAQAAWNFATPLTQVFPPEFHVTALRLLAEARKSDLGPYKLVNVGFLHNPDLPPAGPDPGTVLLRTNHPMQFAPYLYEGYSAELRRRYRAKDLSMRVVRLAAGGPAITGHPAGPVELTLKFPAIPYGLLPEPLLTTGGRNGAWDSLYVNYPDDRHIQFGLDHPGAGAILSPVLPLDRSRPHRLLVNLGSLFPAGSAGRHSPTFVFWDDVRVLQQVPGQSADSLPEEITIGHNFVGSSVSIPQLSADILGFRRLAPHDPDSAFATHPGTLELQLLPLDSSTPFFEPLLSAGPPGRGDVVFLRAEGGGMIRFGHDHWGGNSALSAPVPTDTSRMLRLIVAHGAFFPPTGAFPADATLRKLYLRCNDTVVFNRFTYFHPSAPEWLAVGRNVAASTLVEPRARFPMLCTALASPDVLPETQGYPGAVRVTLRFFNPPQPGQSQPLLSTGRTGAGDLLFIRFEPNDTYRIGLDHWGHGLILSEPQPYEPAQPLDLFLSVGSLYPPDDPASAPFQHRLLVRAGPRVVLDQPASFHPALPASRVLGLNAIGASTASPTLAADVIAYAPVSPEEMLSSRPAP